MYKMLKNLVLAAAVLTSSAVFAGTKSAARTALESGNYSKTISLLANQSMKSAEEFYLLGKAYKESGDRMKAAKAWNDCIQINKTLGKKDQWAFLFSPNKTLSGTQKKQLYNDFQSEFKQLSSAASRALTTESKELRSEAAHTKIDANMLTKKADAKTEAIKSKQRVADRQAKTAKKPVVVRKGSGIKVPAIVVVIILLIIAFFVIFGKKSDEDEFEEARFGTTRYDVYRNDDHFMSGPFWYEGRYFHSYRDFYNHHGYYYTNAMYMDNYDSYGMGQGRDTALDEEILRDIDEREDLRNESAEMEADAEHMEQDAFENDDLAEELQDSAEQFDEEPEFADDEPVEEEPAFEDDAEEEVEEEPEFEEEEVEEEPEFEEEEEPAFEDDEPAFEDDEE